VTFPCLKHKTAEVLSHLGQPARVAALALPVRRPHEALRHLPHIDGRTLIGRWRPEDPERRRFFEPLHDRLGSIPGLSGASALKDNAKLDAYPNHTDQHYPRQHWFARRGATAYGIVLDPHGKIAWGRADIGGDPIVAVLTNQVRDAHLAGLREDGVSYIFAGARELDLNLALEVLNYDLALR
jgi:hypothetical protein